jgi:hypothetical protein
MEDFLNEQSINIVQRILKEPNHPIMTNTMRNKYKYTNTINKYTHPKSRRIETTTAIYHVEIAAKLHKQRPLTKRPPNAAAPLPYTSMQCPLCVFKAKNIKDLIIHKGRMHK